MQRTWPTMLVHHGMATQVHLGLCPHITIFIIDMMIKDIESIKTSGTALQLPWLII